MGVARPRDQCAGKREPNESCGVLFDYGETLVEFTRPEEALRDAERRILALLTASGRAGPSPAGVRAVQDRVEREVVDHQRSGNLEEIDVAAASSRAYAEAGVHLDAALLDEVLRVEQEAWWHGAHLDPEAVPLLDTLRCRGLRVGLCSNAPYRVESLRAQLAFLGLDIAPRCRHVLRRGRLAQALAADLRRGACARSGPRRIALSWWATVRTLTSSARMRQDCAPCSSAGMAIVAPAWPMP